MAHDEILKYLLYAREMESALHMMRQWAHFLKRELVRCGIRHVCSKLENLAAAPLGFAILTAVFAAAVMGALYGVYASRLHPVFVAGAICSTCTGCALWAVKSRKKQGVGAGRAPVAHAGLACEKNSIRSCRRLLLRQIHETSGGLRSLYAFGLLQPAYRNFASISALCEFGAIGPGCFPRIRQFAPGGVEILLREQPLWDWEKTRGVLMAFCMNRTERDAKILLWAARQRMDSGK